ncbi:MAG: hypothetical protein AMS17_13805 [Spirochaetes bacterium DG_61]|nr:MAG: hypothetical protein AMS17_13805 [Spirochaetes bacterium DG_61]
MSYNNTYRLLELVNISKTFPGVQALDSVSFDLNAGEAHAVVGENGAGKSTMIKIVTGEYKKDSGDIFISGEQVSIRDTHHAQELGIAVVPQEFQLVPHLNGLENIFLGRLVRNKVGSVDWRSLKARAREIIRFLEWEINLSTPVRKLSVAEMQILQISRALALDSRILILDEPTAMLGEKEIENLFRVIRILKNKGIGIIYISHRLAEIFPICERVTVLRDGKLIGTNFVEKIDLDTIIRMILGTSLEASYPAKNKKLGSKILEVKNLTKKGSFSNINFEVREGEVLGITGLIGAGKTELVTSIFGEMLFDEGEVTIHGTEMKIKSPADAIKENIGLIPDDRRNLGLILGKKIRENVSITILRSLKSLLFVNKKREKDKVRRVVSDLSIKCRSIEENVDYLSGGNQQKVVLAKWLIANSDILIFDEPTKGIDVGAKRQVYQLINDLSQNNKTIIVISMELEELIGLTHRILVMAKGEIVTELVTDKTSENEIMKYAVGGF